MRRGKEALLRGWGWTSGHLGEARPCDSYLIHNTVSLGSWQGVDLGTERSLRKGMLTRDRNTGYSDAFRGRVASWGFQPSEPGPPPAAGKCKGKSV